MKGLVIFTAVVAMTAAQVVFPVDDEESSSSGTSSNDVDAQVKEVFSQLDRNLSSQPTNDDSCGLPDGSLGKCIRFSECSSYSDLYSNLNDHYDFLQARICSLLTDSVQICCPLGNEPVVIPQNPTTQLTGNPRQTTLRPSTLSPIPSGSKNPLFPSECGQSFGNRITQGTEVEVGAYPWLVAIGRPDGGVFFEVSCGGTLITRRHVLTAAHCFARPGSRPTHARLGEHDVTSDNDHANPQDHKISRIIFSNGYDDDNFSNDIALLTLDRDVSFDTNIQPICLPFRPDLKDNNFIGNRMDIVGWGRTNYTTRETSPVPLEAKVEVVTLESCQQSYGSLERRFIITERQLCAGSGGADSCRGDSGGPLHYLDRQRSIYYLAGVTSFGRECGLPDFPGVYTRVGSYLKWLELNVQ